MAESIDDYAQFQALDLAFHRTLMKASTSEIGRTIVATIHDYAGQSRRLNAPGDPLSLEHTLEEHRAIYAALAACDGDAAARKVSEHIEHAWAERRGLLG
jgi:DNA-binding FadR family transcriptional regulator